MKINPHKYQVEAVLHTLKHPDCALFLDLGLGKTVVVLTAIKRLLEAKKSKGCLIIAPLRVVYNVWPQEIQKWDHTKSLTHVILHGKHKDARFKQPANIYITNYESIKWLYSTLKKQRTSKNIPFDTIIFDESTAVKDPKTKRFKMLRGMVALFKRHIILSGEPVAGNLMNIWSQYYILDRGKRLGTSWYRFRQEYFRQVDYYGYTWEPLRSSFKKIGNQVKDISLKMQSSDYLELPKLTNNIIYCSLPSKHQKDYNILEQQFLIELNSTSFMAVNSAALTNKLRQFVSGGMYDEGHKAHKIHDTKLDTLSDILANYKSQSFLIAIQYRFEYDFIKSVFPNVPVIYGGVSVKESSKLIQSWNKKELTRLIVHPASISHGVNLQDGGHNIIWYSLPWSYEQYRQLNGRIYRQNQKMPVTIHHLLTRNTVDESVYAALQTKDNFGREFRDQLQQRFQQGGNK